MAERICPYCNTPLPPDAGLTTCPVCGMALPEPSPPRAAEEEAPAEETVAPSAGQEVLADQFRRAIPLGRELQGLLGGRYRIEAVIGSGGQGVVARARVLHLPQDPTWPEPLTVVAVKFWQAFDEPPRVLETYDRLRGHEVPHLVPLLDHGPEGIWYFLVFPFFPQGAVRPALFQKGEGQVDWPRLRQLVAHVTDALLGLHGLHIVHRDIKPSNLFWDPRTERFYVGDLGMATGRSVSGFRGTVYYMPPEALQLGRLERMLVQPAYDWWSLGITLLELISGRHPFADLPDAPMALYEYLSTQFRRDDFLQTYDLPSAWYRLLAGLLTRDPEARWHGEQVRLWLRDPGRVPVPPDVQVFVDIEFRGRVYHDLKRLARDAWDHWDEAYQAFIAEGRWSEVLALMPERRRQVNRYLLQGHEPDAQLAAFLWHLDPELPFGLREQVWEDETALLEALTGEDPLIPRLRANRLFSLYFGMDVQRRRYSSLRTGPQARPWLEAWEQRPELSGRLLALLFSRSLFEQVRERARQVCQEMRQGFVLAPDQEALLRKVEAWLEELRWEAPDLDTWHRALTDIDRLLAARQTSGAWIDRTALEEYFQEAQEHLARITESIPVDEEGETLLVRAHALRLEMELACAKPLGWPCWRFLQERVLPFLEEVSRKQGHLRSRQGFEQHWETTLQRAKKYLWVRVPMDAEALETRWTLAQKVIEAQKTAQEDPGSYRRFQLLAELEKLLQDMDQAQTASREEVLQDLLSLQEELRAWRHHVLLPELYPGWDRLRRFVEEPLTRLPPDALYQWWRFVHEDLPSLREIVISNVHAWLWRAGAALGILLLLIWSWLLNYGVDFPNTVDTTLTLFGRSFSPHPQALRLFWLEVPLAVYIAGHYLLYTLRYVLGQRLRRMLAGGPLFISVFTGFAAVLWVFAIYDIALRDAFYATLAFVLFLWMAIGFATWVVFSVEEGTPPRRVFRTVALWLLFGFPILLLCASLWSPLLALFALCTVAGFVILLFISLFDFPWLSLTALWQVILAGMLFFTNPPVQPLYVSTGWGLLTMLVALKSDPAYFFYELEPVPPQDASATDTERETATDDETAVV